MPMNPILLGVIDVTDALRDIADTKLPLSTPDGTISYLLNEVKNLAQHGDYRQLGLLDWPTRYMQMGRAAMDLAITRPFAFDDFAVMLMKKHDDYGPMPIRGWGNIGVAIRIDSKWQRYLHICGTGVTNTADEKVSDTLQDIVGYCVLGLRFSTRG